MAVMQVVFWTGNNFSFISDSKSSVKCKLWKLINGQIIIFYSPQMHFVHLTNTNKTFEALYFHWCIFPFHLIAYKKTDE